MSKFKVGDKVRYTKTADPLFERRIERGDEGVVVGKGSAMMTYLLTPPQLTT